MNKKTVEEELHKAEEIRQEMAPQRMVEEKPKPPKSGLTEGKLDEIARKIVFLIEEEKLYQEPELTLKQLSDKLSFPSYQVSQAINESLKRNFYELVNSYRVEEAKRLLIDPGNNNYTILSVGLKAGFNSKTTFNTVFKKFTGFTPTEFRVTKKHQTVSF